jgi:hypothetical protein
MKIAIFANDDLTSNLIFAPLFDLPDVEIVSVRVAASPRSGKSSLLGGAIALLRQIDFRYWLYLAYTNGFFKAFEIATGLFGLPARSGILVSLRALARERNIPYAHTTAFNSPDVIAELERDQIDLLVIRVGAILKTDLLAVPRKGTWCVHSSILPAFKGIAGEFHALRTPGAPVGSTVFRVTPVLDEGPPLAQVAVARQDDQTVFRHMVENNLAAGGLLAGMVKALARSEPVPNTLLNEGVEPSYFSWPMPEQVSQLAARTGGLIGFADAVRLAACALRLRKTLW